MDVFEHLKQEHDVAKQVMEQLTISPDEGVYAQLAGALKQHLGGEEEVVYKALDGYAELHIHVLTSLEEHVLVRGVMAELGGLDAAQETWRAKLKVMRDLILHHIEEEEGIIFPEAERLLGRQRTEELDVGYSEVEERLAA
jgi:hemerythrin-like domain-containing protein